MVKVVNVPIGAFSRHSPQSCQSCKPARSAALLMVRLKGSCKCPFHPETLASLLLQSGAIVEPLDVVEPPRVKFGFANFAARIHHDGEGVGDSPSAYNLGGSRHLTEFEKCRSAAPQNDVALSLDVQDFSREGVHLMVHLKLRAGWRAARIRCGLGLAAKQHWPMSISWCRQPIDLIPSPISKSTV